MGKIKAYSGNRLVDADALGAADRLIMLRKKKPMWEVIDEVVDIWVKKHPKEWKSNLIRVQGIRDTRKEKEFASSKDKGSYLRYLVDAPQSIITMIRILYNPNELNMDKEFWIKFGKRYKAFMIPEKI